MIQRTYYYLNLLKCILIVCPYYIAIYVEKINKYLILKNQNYYNIAVIDYRFAHKTIGE